MFGCFIGSLLEFWSRALLRRPFADFKAPAAPLAKCFTCLEARVTRRAALVLAQVFSAACLFGIEE